MKIIQKTIVISLLIASEYCKATDQFNSDQIANSPGTVQSNVSIAKSMKDILWSYQWGLYSKAKEIILSPFGYKPVEEHEIVEASVEQEAPVQKTAQELGKENKKRAEQTLVVKEDLHKKSREEIPSGKDGLKLERKLFHSQECSRTDAIISGVTAGTTVILGVVAIIKYCKDGYLFYPSDSQEEKIEQGIEEERIVEFILVDLENINLESDQNHVDLKNVLKNISMFEQGNFIVVVGTNSDGKTSILGTIPGTIKSLSDNLMIYGLDAHDSNELQKLGITIPTLQNERLNADRSLKEKEAQDLANKDLVNSKKSAGPVNAVLALDESTPALDQQASTKLLEDAVKLMRAHKIAALFIVMHDSKIVPSIMGNKIWILQDGIIVQQFGADEK